MSFLNSLNYPESTKFKFTLASISSVFIYIFLIFFQPFGVNNYNPTENISLDLIIGIIWIIPMLFLTICFNEFFLRPKLIQRPKPFVLILWFFYVFISVGTSSFLLYNFIGNFHDFNFSSYVNHILEICSVLIFPFFGTIFFYSYQKMVKNYSESLSVSKGVSDLNKVVLLKGDYKSDQIALGQNSIICMQSEDNYLGLRYLEHDEVKKYLIRSTLKKMEKHINSELFVKCNRSIIINLFHLESVKHHSSGLILKVKFIENEVKVSKVNTSKVLELIEKHYSTSIK